jgi:hypothetical protein
MMAREILIWPVSKDTEALAYCDFADAEFAIANIAEGGNPNDKFAYRNKRDAHGQMVTPYLGPTGFDWLGAPFPEPSGGPALRADAVLATSYDEIPVEDDPWG